MQRIGLLGLGFAVAIACWTVFSPATLYPLTAEDGPIETAQFFLYLMGAAFFFQYWRRAKPALPFGGILALIWVAALLFIAGEEISWGQRIFGFETPENMATASRQAEFNIHNLEAAYAIYGSDSKPMLFIELVLGCMLPLFALTKIGDRVLRFWGMPVPPLALVPLFLCANIFGRLFSTHFLELGFKRTATPELAETLLAVALCASGYLIMRQSHSHRL